MPRGQPLEQRFWSKVDKRGPDECWPWTATRNQKGYGHFYIGRRTMRSNRMAWVLANGVDFPADRFACHTCDNPGCCNPKHIWPGTNAENQSDMARKGRLGRRAGTLPKTTCPGCGLSFARSAH